MMCTPVLVGCTKVAGSIKLETYKRASRYIDLTGNTAADKFYDHERKADLAVEACEKEKKNVAREFEPANPPSPCGHTQMAKSGFRVFTCSDWCDNTLGHGHKKFSSFPAVVAVVGQP